MKNRMMFQNQKWKSRPRRRMNPLKNTRKRSIKGSHFLKSKFLMVEKN